MFKLHGSPMSNYYNIVKLTLLEKGLAFEEVFAPPSQTAEFLAISPMGKIPVLEVGEGYLTETDVIVDFLESVHPQTPLLSADPFQKAMIKRIAHMVELYIDQPLRPLMGVIFSGATLSDELKVSTMAQLERGLQGLTRVASPSPWLAGTEYTVADIFAYYCLGLIEPLAQTHLAVNVYDQLPGFEQWKQAMAGREFVSQVDSAQKKAIEAFYQSRQG